MDDMSVSISFHKMIQFSSKGYDFVQVILHFLLYLVHFETNKTPR